MSTDSPRALDLRSQHPHSIQAPHSAIISGQHHPIPLLDLLLRPDPTRAHAHHRRRTGGQLDQRVRHPVGDVLYRQLPMVAAYPPCHPHTPIVNHASGGGNELGDAVLEPRTPVAQYRSEQEAIRHCGIYRFGRGRGNCIFDFGAGDWLERGLVSKGVRV
jgi:hypothetical protein